MALRGWIYQQNSSIFVNTVAVSATAGWTGSAPQSGDIITAYPMFGNDVNASSVTVTPPSGFAVVPTVTQMQAIGGTIPNNTFFSWAYWKLAATESGTYTFTFGTVGDNNSMLVVCHSGRNTVSPFTAESTTAPVAQAGSGPTAFSVTGLTAATGDDILYFLACSRRFATDTLTFTPPSGFANGLTNSTATTNLPISLFADKENVTSGATGTLGGSLTMAGTGNAVAYCGYLISLASSGGGGGSPGPLPKQIYRMP